MTVLYTAEEMERQKRRAKWSGAAAWTALALGWLACAVLCFFVRTGNAKDMLLLIIGLATVSGWVFILLRQMVYVPAHAEAHHMAGILADENKEEFEGVLRLSPGGFQIPKSIIVKKAYIQQGEESVTLNVDASLARRLPPEGALVRVETVRKYITAFEVRHA